MPTISVNDFSSSSTRRSFPSPQPKSKTRFASLIAVPQRRFPSAVATAGSVPPSSFLVQRALPQSHQDQDCLPLSAWRAPLVQVVSVVANSALRLFLCEDVSQASLLLCAAVFQLHLGLSNSVSLRRVPARGHRDDSGDPVNGT